MTSFMRYLIVSIGGLTSDALIVFSAHSLGTNLSASILMGYFFAAGATYLVNDNWTFQQERPSLGKATIYLLIITLGGLIRPPAAHVALFAVESKTLAWAFSVGLSFVFNYLALNFFFRKFGKAKPCPNDK